jgi:hypothetical protein
MVGDSSATLATTSINSYGALLPSDDPRNPCLPG